MPPLLGRIQAMLRYALPRLRDFVFLIVFAGALLSGARMLNTDGDLGRHLTLGSYILSSGHIPTHNILSYTKAGESRPPYEWLSELAFAAAYRLASLDGVVLLSALLIAAAFVFVYRDAAQRSAAPVTALLIALWAAAASSLHWVSRPHLFTFLFFALWLAMLDRVRRGEPQRVWQFPALMLVWVNSHGGFLFGFLAYAAYLAGWLYEAVRHRANPGVGRRFFLLGGASLAASIATPDLWGNWAATLNNRSSFVLAHTAETMPLNPALFNTWPVLGLMVLAILLMWLQRRELAPAQPILLAGLVVSSFAMARNVPLFAIAAAPLCAQWATRALARFGAWTRTEEAFARIDQGLRGFLWPAVAIAAVSAFFVWHWRSVGTSVFQWSPQRFPVAAATWLEKHAPAGRMFNDINWGGYLTFRLWPGQRVFIDSQTDFYGEPFVREYAALLEAPEGWQGVLAKYNADYLVLPPSTPLAAAARQAGWKVGYQDSIAAILIRR